MSKTTSDSKPIPPQLKKNQWKKGQSGNPRGGNSHSKVVRQVKRLTMDEVADLASMVILKNRDELRAVLLNKNTSVLKAWFAAVAVKGIAKGDHAALGALLDRVVGKVKDKVEVTGDAAAPLYARLEALSAGEREAEIVRLRKLRELAGGD